MELLLRGSARFLIEMDNEIEITDDLQSGNAFDVLTA